MWTCRAHRGVVADVDILTGPGGTNRLNILSGSVRPVTRSLWGQSHLSIDTQMQYVNKQTSQSFSL